MERINYEVIYLGKNLNSWQVKDYIVSENNGKWLCSCAIKFRRDPNLSCKHITIVKTFLLDDKKKAELLKKVEMDKLFKKLKKLDKMNCKHVFNAQKPTNSSNWVYVCEFCKESLMPNELNYWRNKKYNKK